MNKISVLIVLIIIFNGFVVAGININPKSNNTEFKNIESFIENISFPEYKIIENNCMTSIEMEGYNYILEPGKPLLPAEILLIALPPNCIFESIDFKGLNIEQIPGFYKIVPSSKLSPSYSFLEYNSDIREIDEQWIKNYELTYKSDDAYPIKSGKLIGQGSFHKISYVSVAVYPFIYHPLSGRLFKYGSIEIKVNYRYEINKKKLDYNYDIDKKASNLFINYDKIKNMYQPYLISSLSSFDKYNYVIITSNDLYNSIVSSKFIGWKSNLGYNIKIINITDSFIEDQNGFDLAEQIRNFLRNYYVDWGIKYVLLVGNYDNVPMRYCYPNNNNHNFNLSDVYSGEVPTDYYYADLSAADSESWDSDGDGFYGEIRDDIPDFAAEVFIGRIPTNNASRVVYTLDKLVTFESDTSEWKNNVLDAGAIAFFTPWKDSAGVIDFIEKDLMEDMLISHYSEQEGYKVSEYDWNPLSEEAFTGDWKTARYGLVNVNAHGWSHGISRWVWVNDNDGDNRPDDNELEWKFFISVNSDLDDDYPSIFFDMSCLVGYPEPSPSSWPEGWRGNLGIDLLTRPSWGASVGVLSATRLAYGGSTNWPYPPGGMESICYEFNKNIIDKNETIGEALYNSKFYTTTNCPLGGFVEYINMYNYNLYGDPSLNRNGFAIIGRPSKPSTPIGKTNGEMYETYNYSSVSFDPEEDQIYYWFDWGNGNNTNWLGPHASGNVCEASYSWSEKGDYEIRVRVKDIHGYISEWSDPLSISIPKSKISNPIIQILLKLLERFLFSNIILNQIN